MSSVQIQKILLKAMRRIIPMPVGNTSTTVEKKKTTILHWLVDEDDAPPAEVATETEVLKTDID